MWKRLNSNQMCEQFSYKEVTYREVLLYIYIYIYIYVCIEITKYNLIIKMLYHIYIIIFTSKKPIHLNYSYFKIKMF